MLNRREVFGWCNWCRRPIFNQRDEMCTICSYMIPQLMKKVREECRRMILGEGSDTVTSKSTGSSEHTGEA